MKAIRILVLLSILCMLMTISVTGQSDADVRLEELLARQVSIPLVGDETVTKAFVNVLLRGRAPGGIATVSGCGQEGKNNLAGGTTSVREYLNAIVAYPNKRVADKR